MNATQKRDLVDLVSLLGVEPSCPRLEGAAADPPRGRWRPERESNPRNRVCNPVTEPSDRVKEETRDSSVRCRGRPLRPLGDQDTA